MPLNVEMLESRLCPALLENPTSLIVGSLVTPTTPVVRLLPTVTVLGTTFVVRPAELIPVMPKEIVP